MINYFIDFQSYINTHVIYLMSNVMLLPKREQVLFLQLNYKETARREERGNRREACDPQGKDVQKRNAYRHAWFTDRVQ